MKITRNEIVMYKYEKHCIIRTYVNVHSVN